MQGVQKDLGPFRWRLAGSHRAFSQPPAAPYRLWFVAFGAISLVAGGVLLARQQMRAARCGADGLCVPASLRFVTLIGLLLAAVLLWLGYRYA